MVFVVGLAHDFHAVGLLGSQNAFGAGLAFRGGSHVGGSPDFKGLLAGLENVLHGGQTGDADIAGDAQSGRQTHLQDLVAVLGGAADFQLAVLDLYAVDGVEGVPAQERAHHGAGLLGIDVAGALAEQDQVHIADLADGGGQRGGDGEAVGLFVGRVLYRLHLLGTAGQNGLAQLGVLHDGAAHRQRDEGAALIGLHQAGRGLHRVQIVLADGPLSAAEIDGAIAVDLDGVHIRYEFVANNYLHWNSNPFSISRNFMPFFQRGCLCRPETGGRGTYSSNGKSDFVLPYLAALATASLIRARAEE